MLLGVIVGVLLSVLVWLIAYMIKTKKIEIKHYDPDKVYKIKQWDGLWTVLSQNEQGVGFQRKVGKEIRNMYLTHSQIKEQGVWETPADKQSIGGELNEAVVDEGTFERIN